MLWAMACWPIWQVTDQLIEFDDRKNSSYLRSAAHASHHVERVDIPFGRATLPAWLHLPPGDRADRSEPLPTVLACGGMDAPREICVAREGDQIAATQPSLLGCAAALPVFEPGCTTIFSEAAPTFKARHMFMAWMSADEAAFDSLVEGYDLRPLIGNMRVPWLVIAGEADELSPVSWVYDMVARCPAPTSLLLYAGARHSLTESLAALTGPSWRTEIADWLSDRVHGIPAVDLHRYVDPTGQTRELPMPS